MEGCRIDGDLAVSRLHVKGFQAFESVAETDLSVGCLEGLFHGYAQVADVLGESFCVWNDNFFGLPSGCFGIFDGSFITVQQIFCTEVTSTASLMPALVMLAPLAESTSVDCASIMAGIT